MCAPSSVYLNRISGLATGIDTCLSNDNVPIFILQISKWNNISQRNNYFLSFTLLSEEGLQNDKDTALHIFVLFSGSELNQVILFVIIYYFDLKLSFTQFY